jgi:hypothetical protein
MAARMEMYMERSLSISLSVFFVQHYVLVLWISGMNVSYAMYLGDSQRVQSLVLMIHLSIYLM